MHGGVASDLLRQRDEREKFLPRLGEPSWTMLLILWDAQKRDRKLIISSLCCGCHAPYTTALRHLGSLERSGLVERTAHPLDERASFISLTVLAQDKLASYGERIAA